MKLSKLNLSLITLFIVITADQVLKFWIKTHMMLGEEFPVLGNWFLIHFVENNGMAFGFELAGEFGKIILSTFRILAAIIIGWYIVRLTRHNSVPAGLIITLSLIFAGAVGNIIDSACYGLLFDHSYGQVASFLPEGGGYGSFLHGKVVDMLYFPLIRGHYPNWFPFLGGNEFLFFRPVFNIADSAITIGIFSVLIFYRNIFNPPADQQQDPSSPTTDPNQETGDSHDIINSENYHPGSDTSGSDTSGNDAFGSDASGNDTFGSDASGNDTFGSDASGNDTFGSDAGEEPLPNNEEHF